MKNNPNFPKGKFLMAQGRVEKEKKRKKKKNSFAFSSGCSTNFYISIFFTLNLSSSGYRHAGLLFLSMKIRRRKRLRKGHDITDTFCHIFWLC